MSDFLAVCDQIGREVTFPFPPKRILSLVPSQTEFLIDIGAPVVGRTKFCIHPKEIIEEIPTIGGTKNFRFDVIEKLKPDLIIGNKEENYKEGIQLLEKKFPVWMSDIFTLSDAFKAMEELGKICGLEDSAKEIAQLCKGAISSVKRTKRGTVIYLIWQKPWMAAGRNTFVDNLLHHLGYTNLIKDVRYPEITEDQIRELDPEYILFSSEPFPFKEQHVSQAQKIFPNANCQSVDGELYSWYGSRLKYWKNA